MGPDSLRGEHLLRPVHAAKPLAATPRAVPGAVVQWCSRGLHAKRHKTGLSPPDTGSVDGVSYVAMLSSPVPQSRYTTGKCATENPPGRLHQLLESGENGTLSTSCMNPYGRGTNAPAFVKNVRWRQSTNIHRLTLQRMMPKFET
jgi:hypothetical protein